MSELTLTVMRLGLLIALWLFVFALVGVLRGDLYGTRVSTRPRRQPRGATAPAVASGDAAVAKGGLLHGRRRSGPRKLIVTAGPLSGTSLPLRPQGTLIGRSPECALVLDDDYASGRHARIFHDGQSWLVEDLRSTNGTWLDNHRLGAEVEPVREGSTLRIGRTVVELRR